MSSEAILLTHPQDIRVLYSLASKGIDDYMEDPKVCHADKVRAVQLINELYQSTFYLDNQDA